MIKEQDAGGVKIVVNPMAMMSAERLNGGVICKVLA
jgi:hypothetical protein